MKKILVPTDFSPHSKSGIRFAIQWASQQNLELVYIHVLNSMVPTRWPQSTATKYITGELEACLSRLRKFIKTIYKSMKVQPGLYSTVLIQEHNPAKTILEYCRNDQSVDCICISTNGADSVMKLFGTNTSELIAKSPLPILAIPKKYKIKEVKSILYATDFFNYKQELAKVVSFANLFKAKVEIVHFAWPGEFRSVEEALQKISGKYENGLNVNIDESNPSLPLADRLQKIILKRRPSIVVLFTNQERNFIQKIFNSSKSQDLSFQLKTPLLVFSKMKVSSNKKKHELA